MKNSFVLYTEYFEHIQLLTMEQRGELLTALMLYQMGEKVEVQGITNMAFSFIRSQLDRDNLKYEETCRKRREAGAIGGKQRVANQANASKSKQKQANQADNDNEYENDIKEKTPKGSTKKSTAFQPPTHAEVAAYVSEKGLNVDSGRFVDFYESKGWMVGKNKMKDWKAACRNWSKTQRKERATKANNFTQRNNDYDELQRQLLERSMT